MIQKIAIVGMGALGLLYADQLASGLKEEEAVSFVMNEERIVRHRNDKYTINGVKKHFPVKTAEEEGVADLVIVAVKYTALESAMCDMAPCVGPDTVILSVMNGIITEELLAERFGEKHLLYAVAQGMDAMRDGSTLIYTRCGKLYIGTFRNHPENVKAVQELFERAKVPFVVEEDIMHRLWYKFMINVGVNQTCLCYDTNYGQATTEGTAANLAMVGAMREVIAVAEKEGVALTEEDLISCCKVLQDLSPDAYPSMEQDGKAKRHSEVELFAGTMLRLGKQYGVPTPYNRFFYDRIKEIEANY